MSFALPGILSLIVSTLVFFVALRYLNHYLDEQEIPKGMTRSMLVLVLAAMVSLGTGKMVDWAQAKIAGPQTSKTHTLPHAP